MVSPIKLQQDKAVRDGIRHASKMQKMNFRAQMVTVDDLLKENFVDDESTPGAREKFEQSLAFTYPGGLDVWVNTDRLYETGSDAISTDAIMMLLNHEAGHLSLTPVYYIGQYHELMAIIHQPNKPHRFPVTFLREEEGRNSLINHLFCNLYMDCIINYSILENPYCNKEKEVKISIAKGMLDVFSGIIQTGTPPYVEDVWRDIPVQACRKILGEEGIEPYASEGYVRKDDLEKMEELNFKFNERNRELHNHKVAELMWWLRFVKQDNFLVNLWSDSRIEEMAELEEDVRDVVIKKEVIRKFAKRIAIEKEDIMEWELTDRIIDENMPEATREFQRVYDETYGVDPKRFAEEIGIELWDDVKDEVIGAGVDIDDIGN